MSSLTILKTALTYRPPLPQVASIDTAAQRTRESWHQGWQAYSDQIRNSITRLETDETRSAEIILQLLNSNPPIPEGSVEDAVRRVAWKNGWVTYRQQVKRAFSPNGGG